MPEVKVLQIDRDHPQEELISVAAHIIRAGGVAAYLTDTLYGLGADAFNVRAVERVFEAKSRIQEKALPVIIGEKDFLSQLVTEISETAETLIDHFWPGPLSLILLAAPALPALLHGDSGKVAVRLPACAVSRALAVAAGGALTATSANRSGQAAAQSAGEVIAMLGDAIDLVVDSGPSTKTRPSTIVDLTVSPPRLLRDGAYAFEKLNAVVPLQK